MPTAEERLIEVLLHEGIDFICYLPCEKIRRLLDKLQRLSNSKKISLVPLTREEEGVGICAGASLAGRKTAMFIQSSGFGNMINALMSLTVTYHLPLSIFISHRGVYKEKIPAQVPLGQKLEDLLKALRIGYTILNHPEQLQQTSEPLQNVYLKKKIHAFLLRPSLWEQDEKRHEPSELVNKKGPICRSIDNTLYNITDLRLKVKRFELLRMIKETLSNRIVVANLGVPSKELYYLKHQPSNFYMLGSMGLATAVGLGLCLSTDKEVIVLEGDGSILMNPGTLATVAYFNPSNLTILAIDNGSYGSTGNQPTLTSTNVDLATVAIGFGLEDIHKTADPEEVIKILHSEKTATRFIHFLALPGNADVGNIPLAPEQITETFQNWLIKD